MGDIFFLWDFL